MKRRVHVPGMVPDSAEEVLYLSVDAEPDEASRLAFEAVWRTVSGSDTSGQLPQRKLP